MPIDKFFWLAPRVEGKQVPETLLRAGYEAAYQIRRLMMCRLKDSACACEFTERAIQDVEKKTDPSILASYPNPVCLVHNRVRALVRREQRINSRLEFLGTRDIDLRSSSDCDDVVDRIARDEMIAYVSKHLDPDERELLKWILLERSSTEIAKRFGITRNAFYKRRRSLRAKISRLFDELH